MTASSIAKGSLSLRPFLKGNVPALLSALFIASLVACALAAPLVAPYDPFAVNPLARLQPASWAHPFGTDGLGRDVFSRAIWGARTSLTIGVLVALAASVFGAAFGLVCGYFRMADVIVMRIMDGIMSIPGILLAIALTTLTKAGLAIVLLAIAVPEIPRVARLIRSSVLSIKQLPFIEAGLAISTPAHVILLKHILPNTIAPLLVQATFISSSAILLEAYLAFLGVGMPPSIPSWGNIVADGRLFIRVAPGIVIFPGLLLGLTVLSANVLGDALRDRLDIKLGARNV